jgi:hypothetical protein
MIASVTVINGLVGFQRPRLLPVDGRVVAHIGQQVMPETVLAEAIIAPHVEVLDARVVFSGVNRANMKDMIERNVGEKVEKGDVIIATGGKLNRVLRATTTGIIRSISTSQVLLEAARKPFQLRAGYTGTIQEIIPERGVMLRMQGSLVQGVWGNGHLVTGKLISATIDARKPLQAEDLRGECVDAIVLAGRCRDADTLQRAAMLPVRGLILGTISSHLIPMVRSLKFPVMVVNGFSPSGMDESAYRLLRSNQGRRVSLLAQAWDRELGIRPEVFIPLPAEDIRLIQELIDYREGLTVRINTLPYMAQVGTISFVHPDKVTLPNGLMARAADVTLKNGQSILVPLNNLDVLE